MTLTLIGCGKMGGAMLRGWADAAPDNHFYVVEPHGLPPGLEAENNIHLTETPPDDCDIIVLAVKPQIMRDVCTAITPKPDTLILSIAAGQTLENFSDYFGPNQPVIRAMPNTPAAIARGITVMVANNAVTPDQKIRAAQLLSIIGAVEWVDNESLMDAVTALSGSGPAYLFHMVEAMTQAGIANGLPADLAARLARTTITGSAALLDAEPHTPPETLRQNVTSPGGTTEAGLEVLMTPETGLTSLMTQTINAAHQRSIRLRKS